MSTTVIVALITSISTLTGAAISGAITLRITSVQSRVQTRVFEYGRAEDRIDKKRQLRRDSYEALLNQISAIEQILDRLWSKEWNSESADVNIMMTALDDALKALTPSVNMIALEGSEDIWLACKKLHTLLYREKAVVAAEVVEKLTDGYSPSKNQDLFKDVYLKRSSAIVLLARMMQEILEFAASKNVQ